MPLRSPETSVAPRTSLPLPTSPAGPLRACAPLAPSPGPRPGLLAESLPPARLRLQIRGRHRARRARRLRGGRPGRAVPLPAAVPRPRHAAEAPLRVLPLRYVRACVRVVDGSSLLPGGPLRVTRPRFSTPSHTTRSLRSWLPSPVRGGASGVQPPTSPRAMYVGRCFGLAYPVDACAPCAPPLPRGRCTHHFACRRASGSVYSSRRGARATGPRK